MCLYSEIPCIELCAQWALHYGPFETFYPLTDIQETYYSCNKTNRETMGLRASETVQALECSQICLNPEDMIFLIMV